MGSKRHIEEDPLLDKYVGLKVIIKEEYNDRLSRALPKFDFQGKELTISRVFYAGPNNLIRVSFEERPTLDMGLHQVDFK